MGGCRNSCLCAGTCEYRRIKISKTLQFLLFQWITRPCDSRFTVHQYMYQRIWGWAATNKLGHCASAENTSCQLLHWPTSATEEARIRDWKPHLAKQAIENSDRKNGRRSKQWIISDLTRIYLHLIFIPKLYIILY